MRMEDQNFQFLFYLISILYSCISNDILIIILNIPNSYCFLSVYDANNLLLYID